MDLGSLKSIKNFVETFKKMNLPLHYLINNAGVYFKLLFLKVLKGNGNTKTKNNRWI